MNLAEGRIQAFLAARQVVVLATVQPDGAPLAMPMWFLHDPASLTMITVADTQKVRNLRRDARVCVVAEWGETGAVQGGACMAARSFSRKAPSGWRWPSASWRSTRRTSSVAGKAAPCRRTA